MNKWRVSKSGYTIRTGLGDNKRIIAAYPFNTQILDGKLFEQWLEDADLICDLHNKRTCKYTLSKLTGNQELYWWSECGKRYYGAKHKYCCHCGGFINE